MTAKIKFAEPFEPVALPKAAVSVTVADETAAETGIATPRNERWLRLSPRSLAST